MIFTYEEKRLLVLYYFGSAGETAENVRDAIADATDPDERKAACSLLLKLENMSEAEFGSLDPESGCVFV